MGGFEGSVNSAVFDILIRFGQTGINNPALLRSVLVICLGKLRDNGNNPSSHFELDLIAGLDSGLTLQSNGYHQVGLDCGPF